ncbi:UNVERIFIED_CONTAM: TPD1 protein1 [Sesamum radiatum]|uniref:TPD1 protein1 n=1 Tax=Sesamum radiatum TaxID=300843 RepID=A0AAW2T3H7_SESRA
MMIVEEHVQRDDIIIHQGPSRPLPDGTPTYTVHIMNVCTTGSCSISNIHLHCGWFSSARKINPTIFRRIAFDDCLVNDGNPLNPGESISFQYAQTFPYPLSVSSVTCN